MTWYFVGLWILYSVGMCITYRVAEHPTHSEELQKLAKSTEHAVVCSHIKSAAISTLTTALVVLGVMGMVVNAILGGN